MFIFGGAAASSQYQVSRSLRFNSADSAYLNFTSGTPTDNNKWTYSTWVKLCAFGASQPLLGVYLDSSNFTLISINSSDKLAVDGLNSGATVLAGATTQVFRDPSAWYHIVVVGDRAQGTDSNRIKMYVNGIQVTSFSTTPSWNSGTNSYINNATRVHHIGRFNTTYANAYMTETHFIDGQALDPTSFAETNNTTNQWIPKAYSGTYGTNGFKLKFSDNSNTTAATLGADSSGNGNNWTPNNFSVTAGVGNDSLVDSPTDYNSDTGAGGEVRGTYATHNPLHAKGTFSNGNLDFASASSWQSAVATMALPTSGKWYVEFTAGGVDSIIGICANPADVIGDFPGRGATTVSYGYNASDGKIYTGPAFSGVSYGNTFGSNDVIGIAYDADNGKLFFSKNGTWQNSGDPAAGTNAAKTGLTGTQWFLAFGQNTAAGGTSKTNYGQRPFASTAPSGYKALCTKNLPDPTIIKPNLYFDVNTRTGTGASFNVTGKFFQPDLVWIKGRSGATDHAVYDSLRGVQKRLETNNTDAQVTSDGGLTAFNSDGYTGSTLAQINTNTSTYVDWMWKSGATPGLSILNWTGNGTNRTIAHGLGIAPKFMIVKATNTPNSVARDWLVWHTALAGTEYILLDTTGAKATSATQWNSTVPDATNISIGTDPSVNGNTGTVGDYIAYVFSEITGFSKFSSYTGNGSADGPFVHCGFKPKFILLKNAGAAGNNWFIWDSSRDSANVVQTYIFPSSSSAESTDVAVDFLSNGFKVRSSSGNYNTSSGTYIFAAFAESPFKYSRAR